MNTDFRLSTSYFTHPKIKRLRRRLGGDGCFAHVGLLGFAAVHRPGGNLDGFDAVDIADGSGWEGDPQAFVDTLIELRLLDRDEGGALLIHDWAEHNTWAAEAQQRSQIARANAQARWKKERAGKQAKPADGQAKAAPPAPAQPPLAAADAAAVPPHVQNDASADAAAVPPHVQNDASADAAAVPPHVQNDASADAAAVPPLCSYPIVSSPLLPSPSVANPIATTPSESDARAPDRPRRPAACPAEVVALLLAQGISEGSARELLGRRSCEAIRQYLDDWPERLKERREKGKPTDDPPGLLFRAIQDGWARPEGVKRRIAEEATRRKVEEATARNALEAERREALRRADAERLEQCWLSLPQEARDGITEECCAAMLRVAPWMDQAEKYGEAFWGREKPRAELLRRCRIALVERDLAPPR